MKNFTTNKNIFLFLLIFVGAQVFAQTEFITTWKTDNPGASNDTSITIPTVGGGFNYDVSWENDGNWETGITGDATHDYGTAGTYTVAIRGSFPRIFFYNSGDKEKILSIEQWGTNTWSSMVASFYGCINLVGNASDAPDLSAVTNLYSMFSGASSFNGDIGNWDVSQVTDMEFMFNGASAFNGNIGSWDVSNVTTMRTMFQKAEAFNQDIGNWDVSKVTDMSYMFFRVSEFNSDISAWDVSKVTDMSLMFYNASAFNADIGNWNVSKVTDMTSMFHGASAFNQDIGNWDVGNVTDMNVMFGGASAFNQNLNDWDVSKVTGMAAMFSGASAFNADIGNWDVGNVTNMAQMFLGNAVFNQDIDNWDVSKVTSMVHMFNKASAFNADIGNWDVSNVNIMYGMFIKASTFNQDISNWDVSNVNTMYGMFWDASAFNQDLGNWDVGNVTDMTDMFKDVALSTDNYDALLNGWNSLTLQNDVEFNVGNSKYCSGAAARENMIDTFGWTITDDGQAADCEASDYFVTTWKTDNSGTSNNTSITIPTEGSGYDYDVDWENDGNWETGYTGNATHDYGTTRTYTVALRGDFPRIYFNDSGDKDKILSIEQWGSNTWSSMNGAFHGCSNLVVNATDDPDLSEVTDMSYMFAKASIFNRDTGSRNVGNTNKMDLMFLRSSTNSQGIGSWNVSKVTNMDHLFDQASAFDQDLGNWNVSNVTTMTDMFKDAALSTANYDATLSGWSNLALQSAVIFNGGNSKYCSGAAARANMIDTFGWIINDGGLAEGCELSIADAELSIIRLYPNPATHSVVIENQSTAHLQELVIYDLIGRFVKTIDLQNMAQRASIDVSNLDKATYFINITTDQGRIVKKLIKN